MAWFDFQADSLSATVFRRCERTPTGCENGAIQSRNIVNFFGDRDKSVGNGLEQCWIPIRIVTSHDR